MGLVVGPTGAVSPSPDATHLRLARGDDAEQLGTMTRTSACAPLEELRNLVAGCALVTMTIS